MTRTMILVLALALGACGNSSKGGPSSDGGASRDAGTGPTSPCSPGGSVSIYGTFQISGTLPGTETICGLSLGSFDGGTLTIAQGSGTSGPTVTVTGSGAGHIDVSDCAATVSGCTVSTSMCAGSTDPQASVSLNLSVTATTLSGSSELGFNSCQAPGLSFMGTR